MLTNILPATNLLLIITISVVAIHNFRFLATHRKNKNKLREEMSELYPMVKPEFYNQPLVQQVVENNHEIHEMNKRIEALENEIRTLRK